MQLFDMHCDAPTACYAVGASLCRNGNQWDLTRVRRYTPCCQVLAVWVPDTLRGGAAWRYCRRVLDYACSQEQRYPQQLMLVPSRERLETAVATGRCGGILAVENGAALGGRLCRVSQLAAVGVRVLTLTWNGSNELGHGCLSRNPSGLTPFGKQVVEECRRVGIVPDVSHLNEAGFWSVATLDDRPFIASHSLSAAVQAHPRNISDAQFKEICRRRGLVGLSLCIDHLGGSDFDALYRHLNHFYELGGETAVAWGGDLDGTALPDGWDGVAVYAALREFLSRKGLSEALLQRLFFQNAYEFFANSLQFAENAVQ